MRNGIEVDGLAAFKATTADAARDLDGLERAHQAAGDYLAERARPRTPRQTGTLAAGVRSDAASGLTLLEDEVEYAGVIHGGWAERNIEPQPWLADTVHDETAGVTDIFVDSIDDIVHQIHGT